MTDNLEDGWIKWEGGDCPLDPGQLYDRRYRDGKQQFRCRISERRAYNNIIFRHFGREDDIIAYRLVSK